MKFKTFRLPRYLGKRKTLPPFSLLSYKLGGLTAACCYIATMNITVAVGEKKDHFSAKNKYIKSFCAQFFSKSEQKVRF